MMKCEQKKCCYHTDNGLNAAMQCPTCSECGADSNILSENCTICYNCTKDLGILRGNNQRIILKIKQKVKQCPQINN